MKNLSIFLCLLAVNLFATGQIYQRTGKNFGVYLSAQPFSRVSQKVNASSPNSFSGAIGFVHMVYPGIFPMLGYSLQRFQSIDSRNGGAFHMQNAHSIDAALLLDKRVLKLLNGRRVFGGCHFLSLGLIVAPEYHYMFGSKDIKNNSLGEVGMQMGLSFYHYRRTLSKCVQGKTRQYDIFYRRGFTPIFMADYAGDQSKFYRDEIGLRVRFIRHQVSNFLE
jgi:hypothetical protein